MRTLNDCNWLTETRREYWIAGLGHIVANHCKFGLVDIPPYCIISVTKYELKCADGARIITKMLLTHDGEHIQAIYG